MKNQLAIFSGNYLKALRKCLKEEPRRGAPAASLATEAESLGLALPDLARIHERAVAALTPGECPAPLRAELRAQPAAFFLRALDPVKGIRREWGRALAGRKTAAAALALSEERYRALVRQSRATEQRLRRLSHQVLSAQEEERRVISRELHDQIAQVLVGVNAHLATLRSAAAISGVGLSRQIRSTQRMVEKSVRTIHRFARELRPPVLDDLGLIPAFQAYMKSFSERSGVQVRFTVYADIEQLHGDKRTVLYRVAQEALTNVARHAKATRVVVTILKKGDAVEMHLHDNGVSFDAERALLSTKNGRMGLIGMRERVEMVGGRFTVSSTPGKGTMLAVRIPFHKAPRGGPR